MSALCGRFTLLENEIAIKERFDISTPLDEMTTRYNIAPGEKVFAVIFDGKERRGGYIRWGLVPSWARDRKVGNKMINARVETSHEKPSFRPLLNRKRCLIVADSFYEWQTTSLGKRVHRIQVKDKKLFAFAGLWDKWVDGDESLFTCTMLTKDANDFMRPIHHRMPIILPMEEENTWLTHSFESPLAVQQFLLSLRDPSLQSYEVSSYVNSVRNDDMNCIQPLQS